MIRTTALLLALCAAPMTAPAQETPPLPELDESFDLFADGAREFFENLESELSPLLKDLGEQFEGLSRYEAPEILPNGDILIRRKPDPETLPPAPRPEGTTEMDAPVEL
ncbi:MULTISPECIES: AAA+ family ATPase [unclassified Dinoroseobacter]|uniref:AAA+ family ATPase n=1 Tax=unclassified Dinoroseobacter TaxID=2620028 RepID=UPI003C7CE1E6